MKTQKKVGAKLKYIWPHDLKLKQQEQRQQ